MTCICGHHAAVHRAMCGAPEGCDCNQFRKPAPNPDPFVDEAKARQDAEWLAGSEAVARVREYVRNRWDSGEYSNPVVSIFADNADNTKSHSLTEFDLRTLLALAQTTTEGR